MNMDALPMWVVYANPSDFPGKFVVRRQLVYAGQVVPDHKPRFVGDSLEEARASIPPGLYRQNRHPEDESQIVETWF